MVKLNSTICITGASGMIGRHILRKLQNLGFRVRVLTRNFNFSDSKAEVVTGDICDLDTVKKFLKSAEIIFHCAGELKNQSKMWAINVKGTYNLLQVANKNSIKFFCHLSSAGVIGKIDGKLADENTPCTPLNLYEKSKYSAEKLFEAGISICNTAILRPTNVIDEHRVGALEYPIRNTLADLIKVFIKGGECAHIIHASDVADAAIFLMNKEFNSPGYFIVSCDEEKYNTYSELWSLYKNIPFANSSKNIESIPHLPIIIPYIFRRMIKGKCNRGDVRYSSAKLRATGFKTSLGVIGAVNSIAEFHKSMHT